MIEKVSFFKVDDNKIIPPEPKKNLFDIPNTPPVPISVVLPRLPSRHSFELQRPSLEPERGPSLEPERGPSLEPERGPSLEPERGPSLEPERGPSLEPEWIPSLEISSVDAIRAAHQRLIRATVSVAMSSFALIQMIYQAPGSR
jgi:hypothetical protein